MVEVLQLAGAISVITITVIASVIKSLKGGYLGTLIDGWRAENDAGSQAHHEINERLRTIDETTQRTETKVEDVDDRVDDVAKAVLIIHEDDDHINDEALRERLEVDELNSDLLEGD